MFACPARGFEALGPARQEARSALDCFDKLGAAREAFRAEALLKELVDGAPVAVSTPEATPEASAGPIDHPLTSRELEVLRLVAKGLSDKEIADRLHLSGHTVHRHISNIRTKLGLPSRSAAVAWAAQQGLLQPLRHHTRSHVMNRSALFLALALVWPATEVRAQPQTTVSIEGEQFFFNGEPTYTGRIWNGHRIEGLLFNSRMVQGVFDDLNPETRERFVYPDTGRWDPDRNTDEFVAAMPSWVEHGVLGFTLNLQGGSPMGYGNKDWVNSAFDQSGTLRSQYLARLERILDRANDLGMVVILGYFYFGQDQNLEDEAAVLHAADNATSWVLDNGYRNVVVEVANECDNDGYDQPVIMSGRVDELMRRIKGNMRDGRRLLVGVSFNGNTVPTPNVVRESDFILIHGNGVEDPRRVTEMVELTRQMEDYRPMPIVFNEDDHYRFEDDLNNLTAAVASYASWGFFDFRREGEGFNEGFQSVPVDWQISSERKKGFFRKVREITGY